MRDVTLVPPRQHSTCELMWRYVRCAGGGNTSGDSGEVRHLEDNKEDDKCGDGYAS
jgi:hypothetical protein